MREQLRDNGVSDTVVDDAVLILSELLSNACRHGRPLGRQTEVGDGDIRASWRVDRTGGLTVEVTDGGGPTRPVPATPSVTARGGRGLNIISALAQEWGVRDDTSGEVTVWALVSAGRAHKGFTTRRASPEHPAPGHGGAVGREALNGPDDRTGRDSRNGRNSRGGLSRLGGMEGLDFADAFDDAG